MKANVFVIFKCPERNGRQYNWLIVAAIATVRAKGQILTYPIISGYQEWIYIMCMCVSHECYKFEITKNWLVN